MTRRRSQALVHAGWVEEGDYEDANARRVAWITEVAPYGLLLGSLFLATDHGLVAPIVAHAALNTYWDSKSLQELRTAPRNERAPPASVTLPANRGESQRKYSRARPFPVGATSPQARRALRRLRARPEHVQMTILTYTRERERDGLYSFVGATIARAKAPGRPDIVILSKFAFLTPTGDRLYRAPLVASRRQLAHSSSTYSATPVRARMSLLK